MDDYPYVIIGADEWFRCHGLHRPGFPTLLRDALHHFGYIGTPRTVAAYTISSGWGAAWSMWTSWLNPLTQL
jgi:hypothetical protein